MARKQTRADDNFYCFLSTNWGLLIRKRCSEALQNWHFTNSLWIRRTLWRRSFQSKPWQIKALERERKSRKKKVCHTLKISSHASNKTNLLDAHLSNSKKAFLPRRQNYLQKQKRKHWAKAANQSQGASTLNREKAKLFQSSGGLMKKLLQGVQYE